MSIENIAYLYYVVDLESERTTTWPEGARVFCKDTRKLYILTNGVFIMQGLDYDGISKITVGTTQPTSPSVGNLWIDTN